MTLAERLSALSWGGPQYPSYEGRLDRAANQQATNAEQQAVNTSNTEAQNAATERAAAVPFYRSEMTAQHGFNPGQTQELLNAAGAGVAGAGATATGQAASQAARTRNTSGFSSALDQNARQREQAMGNLNAGIGAQDVMEAKKENQAGVAGMANLYGTDTKAMLAAMGQEPADIMAEMATQQHGWVQDLSNGISIGQQAVNLINSAKSGGAMGNPSTPMN